ncbi:hypothetical protein [Vibrio kanaloae]|uniref:hypothetical protein n=1 Tax=Vibrio kanaloae TaxID=170673 RepID=UPI001EFEC288|nr:hypothetical protein [Vibrio kanaloae]MCG9557920.1 hypothetical protein [Vibrio kanaloae]
MASKPQLLDNIDSLTKLIEASDYEILVDTGPLYQLKSTLERSEFPSGLKYSLIDLEFDNVSQGQFITGNWDADSLEVKLHLDIKMDPNKPFKYGNVKEALVEIDYEALTEDGEIARGAWHLDYHHHKKGQPNFIHPRYHMHHGGRRIKDNTENYGELVLLDTPRLQHPPLDLFLAFDLVLTNFFERRVWQNFREDTTYKEIIRLSHEHWWKDYYSQIADYWKFQTSGVDDVQKRTNAQQANPYLIV